jgi:hypothetical protein
MRRPLLASLLVATALCGPVQAWAASCTGAGGIGTATEIGIGQLAASATELDVPTTALASATTTIAGFLVSSGDSGTVTVTDTLGAGTYNVASTVCVFNTSARLKFFYGYLSADLIAPSTATGSISTTTVTWTTNPGTLAVKQAITGTGVTAGTKITGGISQWNGAAASATVNNSQTVASETLTLSQQIVILQNNFRSVAEILNVSGIDSSSALDAQATCQSGTSTSNTPISPAVTLTPGVNNVLVVAVTGINSSFTNYAANSPFTTLTSTGSGNPNASWGCEVINTAPASISSAPSWTTGRAYGSGMWTLKASSGTSSHPNFLLLGVTGDDDQ